MSAPDREATRSLAAVLTLPLPLAALLLQRGFGDLVLARTFLRPTLDSLADPLTLAGMAGAVREVVAAVRAGVPILVHGDYDVDGQCATALLTRALRIGGATVHAFVPHRIRDGYDFGAAGLAEAQRVGAGLILTCDCGITAVETVRQAKDAGFRVVVTDHHLPGPLLPPADAVVDPQRADDNSGLGTLCGTGIAFKLVEALVEPLGLPKALPMHLLDYVALATVADVVPLVGENRVLVKHGLRVLADSRWAGLRALLRQTDLGGGRELRAGQVGFILAPRLNAVGRIAEAKDGLRLLLTDDAAEAATLAAQLDSLNRERQTMDQQMLDEALAEVDLRYADPAEHAALVLTGDWHAGVVGIVASRIVERYGRPTILIGLDGDIGKGSGRSIDRFDLHAALTGCGDLLVRFGGHRMAAGLTIQRDQIDAFRERFSGVAREWLVQDDLGPTQRVDLEVGLSDVTDDLERLGRYLEPCGAGNPSPVYGVRGVRLTNSRVVGAHHFKTTLVADGRSLDAIAFGWAERMATCAPGLVDVAFKLERNEYRGTSSLQGRLVALGPHQVS